MTNNATIITLFKGSYNGIIFLCKDANMTISWYYDIICKVMLEGKFATIANMWIGSCERINICYLDSQV